jgi:hypothetical protein
MFKSPTTRKILEYGGYAAAVVLIAFGIVTIVLGVNGRNTVNSNLKAESIVGTSDMTPSAIKAESAKAGLTNVTFPTHSVAGQAIDNGTKARYFAQYMRIHALEGTGGYTYAQMGRFQEKPGTPASQLAKGGGTDNQDFALIDPKTKQPVANGARNLWVTETALTSALNLAYTASQISLFSIVVGIALLLTGLGFGILALAGAVRGVRQTEKEPAKATAFKAAPTA